MPTSYVDHYLIACMNSTLFSIPNVNKFMQMKNVARYFICISDEKHVKVSI